MNSLNYKNNRLLMVNKSLLHVIDSGRINRIEFLGLELKIKTGRRSIKIQDVMPCNISVLCFSSHFGDYSFIKLNSLFFITFHNREKFHVPKFS